MAESDNGIDAMRARMERASRKPPPARRPAAAGPVAAPDEGRTPQASPARGAADAPQRTRATGAETRRHATRTPARPTAMRLAPDAPPVNLAIRVRRPLDDRLVEIIHALRGRGVRTSKVEVIEMLLWEVADDRAGIEDIRARLGRFRTHAPRAAAGVIPE